jgi:hypothetical protein
LTVTKKNSLDYIGAVFFAISLQRFRKVAETLTARLHWYFFLWGTKKQFVKKVSQVACLQMYVF